MSLKLLRAVYAAYMSLKSALEGDDLTALQNAAAGFEAVVDIYNELDDGQIEELEDLLAVEDAYNMIFGDWVGTNIVMDMYEKYQAYLDEPNKSRNRSNS